MANIKSAKKRILVNETKAARNKAIKLQRQRFTQRSSRFPRLEARVFTTKRLFPEKSPVCQKLLTALLNLLLI